MVNANFVLWALEHEGAASPPDLVRAWVTEYVYQVFLTEHGAKLRDGLRDGASTRGLEVVIRQTLEAMVQRVEVSVTGVRSADFQAAIGRLLTGLATIFGEGMI
jgi:hypothetical protein